MLGFAEFERDMIVQRTMEGKTIARTKNGWREGRPPEYKDEKAIEAVTLLKEYTYTEVEKMTGISKSTLQRLKKKYQAQCCYERAEMV